MTSEELKAFIEKHVPNFGDVAVLGSGVAYHYTPHRSKIEQLGVFRGAAISGELDFTQREYISQPATAHPGVVFAYRDLAEAADEGYDCDLFEISYRSAVTAHHVQERALLAPPTILILTTEILDFRYVGSCATYRTV